MSHSVSPGTTVCVRARFWPVGVGCGSPATAGCGSPASAPAAAAVLAAASAPSAAGSARSGCIPPNHVGSATHPPVDPAGDGPSNPVVVGGAVGGMPRRSAGRPAARGVPVQPSAAGAAVAATVGRGSAGPGAAVGEAAATGVRETCAIRTPPSSPSSARRTIGKVSARVPQAAVRPSSPGSSARSRRPSTSRR